MSEGFFSVRTGHAPSTAQRREGIDETLRTCLWNIVLSKLFGKVGANQYGEISQEYHIFVNLQRNFFKLPMDEFEKHLASRRDWYKDVFFTWEWWRVFDFFEFVARKMIPYDAQEWERDTNAALEAEGSMYRLVGGSVVPLGETVAARSVAEALNVLEAHGLDEALAELKAALALFSKGRETPNTPEALKGSEVCAHATRAVKGACSFATANASATVEHTLADESLAIPLRLQKSCLAVFGASGDQEDATEPELVEAILTQAACTVNLLIARAVRAGVVPARERIAHKPTPPDPWGERHLVRRQEKS